MAGALMEVNSNSVVSAGSASVSAATRPAAAPRTAAKPPLLKQMQLDLGREVRRTCASCGMEFVPSNAEDAALHKKFHEMNATGVDLGRAFVKGNSTRWVYEATRFDEGYVVIIDRKASPAARNQAKKVLEVVNRELSAPDIADDVLWSQATHRDGAGASAGASKQDDRHGDADRADRFKIFLHMKDSRCVGLCLTERIWESRRVLARAKRPSSAAALSAGSSVSAGDVHPAMVGISRIWTSAAWRRKGIAMDLLDCVVSNFVYGMEIPKDQIAFSQPTESGCRLAAAFFGSKQWHVYDVGL